ncbi:hypothetical protein VY397_000645 [Salmonella enterica]|nr:hypothetical protein [Salmonella enterica]
MRFLTKKGPSVVAGKGYSALRGGFMGLLCVKGDGIHSVKTSISRRTCMCVNQSQAYVMLVAVSFLSNLHYPFSTEFNFVTDSQVINQFIFRHLVIPPVLLGQAGGQRVPAVPDGSGWLL